MWPPTSLSDHVGTIAMNLTGWTIDNAHELAIHTSLLPAGMW